MDAEKQKALDAIHAGYPYDVNGKRCTTIAEVNAAWKDPVDLGEPTPPKKAAKKAETVAAHNEAESTKELKT